MGNCLECSSGKNKKDVSILIVGLDNAGKTTTAKRVQGLPITSVAPTVGYTSDTFSFGQFNVTMIDVGGGRRIRDIWKNYFAEVYALIYVVDSSDVERLEESQTELSQLLGNPLISGKPILLLANKRDKEGALGEISITTRLNLDAVVDDHKCPCKVEMCAAILDKKDPAIKNGLTWLFTAITNDFDELSARVEADVEQNKIELEEEMREKRERVRKRREERAAEEAQESAKNGGDSTIVMKEDPTEEAHADEVNEIQNSDASVPPSPKEEFAQVRKSGLGDELLDDDDDYETVNLPGSVHQSRVSLRPENSFVRSHKDNMLSGIISDTPFPVQTSDDPSQICPTTVGAEMIALNTVAPKNGSCPNGTPVTYIPERWSTPSIGGDGIENVSKISKRNNKVAPMAEQHLTGLPPLQQRKLEPIAADASVNGSIKPAAHYGDRRSSPHLPPLRLRPNADSDDDIIV